MVYTASKRVSTQGKSAHELESQIRDFEKACRAASLVLNVAQREHFQSLLEGCSEAHSLYANLYKQRAIAYASEGADVPSERPRGMRP